MAVLELESGGHLEVRFPSDGITQESAKLDLALAFATIHETDLSHGINQGDMLTTEYIQDLAKRFASLGVKGLSGAQTLAVRNAVIDAVAKKRLHYHDARIAWHYGVNPNDLTPSQKVGFLANIQRFQAEAAIVEGRTAGLRHREMYKLMLLATDSEEQAQVAATQRALEEQEELIRVQTQQ